MGYSNSLRASPLLCVLIVRNAVSSFIRILIVNSLSRDKYPCMI